MTYRVRLLTEDDWEALRDIRLQALETDPAAFGSSIERERAFKEMHWRMRLRGGPWWIAERREEPRDVVGLVSALAEPGAPEDDRHVMAMWVRPDARGEGVGSALLHEVHRWAAGEGARTTSLWVVDGNVAAQAAYRSAGYEPTGVRMALPRDPSSVEERWVRELTW